MYIFFDDINIFIFKDENDVQKLPFDLSQIENIIKDNKNTFIISDKNDFYFSFDELKNCSLIEKYQIIKCAKKNKQPNEEIIVFSDEIIKHEKCILQKVGLDTQNEIYKKISYGIIPIEFFISKFCADILKKDSHKDRWWIYLASHNSGIRLIAGFHEAVIVSRFFDKIQEKQIIETLNYIKRYGASEAHLFFDKKVERAIDFYKNNENCIAFYPIDELFKFGIPIKLFSKRPMQPIFKKSDFVFKSFQKEVVKILNLMNIFLVFICAKVSYDVFLKKTEIKKLKTAYEVSDKNDSLQIKLDFKNFNDIKNFFRLINDSNKPFEIFLKISESLPEALRVQELLYEDHALKLKLKVSELISCKFLQGDLNQILEEFLNNMKDRNLKCEILDSNTNIIVSVRKNEIKDTL